MPQQDTTKKATPQKTIEETVGFLRKGTSEVAVSHNRENFKSLETFILGLRSYKTSLESMLDPTKLVAPSKPPITGSVLIEHAVLDKLFYRLKSGNITHTEFLILIQINQIEAVIKEICSIKASSGTINYQTLVETYSSVSIAYKSSKYFEEISQASPEAFYTFKILNHYALAGLLKKTYIISQNELKTKEKIEKVVTNIIYKLIDYKQSEKKYSTLPQLLHAECEIILKAIIEKKHSGELKGYSPLEKTLIKEIANLLGKTKRLTPKDIAKFISETWLPTFANFQFDIENKDKLKTHIAALALLKKDTKFKVKSSMFEVYFKTCFPANPDKVKLCLEELDKYIKKQDELSVTTGEKLQKDLQAIKDNILYLNTLITEHKKFAHIVEPCSLTLPWLQSSLQTELLTMQGQGENSPIVTSLLNLIQSTITLFQDQSDKISILQNTIAQLKRLAIGFSHEKTSLLHSGLIATLDALENNIADLFHADESVRNKAQALIIAALSKIIAESHGYKDLAKFAEDSIALITKINTAADKSEQNKIIGEFLSELIHDVSSKVTKSLFSKSPAVSAPPEQIGQVVQTTSDEYEFLHKELRCQQRRLEDYLKDLNHQAQALLSVSIDPSEIITSGDGPKVLRNLIASPLFEELPLPYSLQDQLQLLQSLQQMHAKLHPLCKVKKEELVVSENNITREMQVAYTDLAKNCADLQKNAEQLRANIQEIYLSHLLYAVKQLHDQELDQGYILEDGEISYDMSVLSKSMTLGEFNARKARYELYRCILDTRIIDDVLLSNIEKLNIPGRKYLKAGLKTQLSEQLVKIQLIHDFNTNKPVDLFKALTKKPLSLVEDSYDIKVGNYLTKASYIGYKVFSFLVSAGISLYSVLTWPIKAIKNVIDMITALIKKRRPESRAFQQELNLFIQEINTNITISTDDKKTILTKISALSKNIGNETLSSLRTEFKLIKEGNPSVSDKECFESDTDARASLSSSAESSDTDVPPSAVPESSNLSTVLFQERLISEKNEYIKLQYAQINPQIDSLEKVINGYKQSLETQALDDKASQALRSEKLKKLDTLLAKVKTLQEKVTIVDKDIPLRDCLTTEEVVIVDTDAPLIEDKDAPVDKKTVINKQSRLDSKTDNKTLLDLKDELLRIQKQTEITPAPEDPIERAREIGKIVAKRYPFAAAAAVAVFVKGNPFASAQVAAAEVTQRVLGAVDQYSAQRAREDAAQAEILANTMQASWQYASVAASAVKRTTYRLWAGFRGTAARVDSSEAHAPCGPDITPLPTAQPE